MKTIAELSGHEKITGKTRHIARRILFLIFLSLLIFPSILSAATMTDYCINPPFIVGGVLPNLLMMFDNSASMYDLNYIDEGFGSCSVTITKSCSTSYDCPGKCSTTTARSCAVIADCPVGETCIYETCNIARESTYCYDKTYKMNQCSIATATACASSTDCPAGQTCLNAYAGNFEVNQYYQYNFMNRNFEVLAGAFPPGGCNAFLVANTVCVGGDMTASPKTVTAFAAKGNYLNWLAASKFDIQKKILTGGKYVENTCLGHNTVACTVGDIDDCKGGENCPDCPLVAEACTDVPNFLQAETRGCVGQEYIKEPNTADFQEFIPANADLNNDGRDDNDPNIGLGVTFGVKGPDHPFNPSAPSLGGQAYIDIFYGDYNQHKCQKAIDSILDEANKQTITTNIEECLGGVNKRFCTLDPSVPCTRYEDCVTTPGICNQVNDGTCGIINNGVCGISVNGICSANNGTCSAGKQCIGGTNAGAACNNNGQCNSGLCSKICSSGGKAGSTCTNDNDCKYSSCTAGKPAGTVCTVNADCNLTGCTAGKPLGTACTVNTDCNTSLCTAGKIGNSCSANSDCNTSSCTAGKPAGTSCSTNTDCDIGVGTCMQEVTTQIKSTFGQSMHSCYQYLFKGADFQAADINMITNPQGCNQIYAQLLICSGGSNDEGRCSVLGPGGDCPGGTCVNGPNTILLGSPALVCSSTYTGYCADNPSHDNWQTTVWVPREFADSDECIKQKLREFCGALDLPPVVDPTDDPSATSQFANLPAILGGTSLAAQLGDPMETLIVQLRKDTPPTGLLNEFSEKIRFGSMSFNYNATPTECNIRCSNDLARTCTADVDCVSPGKCIAPIPCPKKCSITTSMPCTTFLDCPAGETCGATTKLTENLDGSKIRDYIGANGYCSVTTTQSCTKDLDCAGTETCISVGNHSYGLISTIDKMRAAAWTPFTEAFYNAIGYYARFNDPDYLEEINPLSRTDLRINASDFDEKKNPSQNYCQKNNLLLITDGSSTADFYSKTIDLVNAYKSPVDRVPAGEVTIDPAGQCGNYRGSKNIDDIAWVARHRNIKTFDPVSDAGPPASALKNSEMIDTYAVFTGAANGLSGECDSLPILDKTAYNGGTTSARRAEDPEKLYNSLRESFQTIAAGAASGTAASVLASGEGSGANLIQALFYTIRDTFGVSTIDPGIKWTGTLKNLWYYIDPFLGNSSIREDAAPKDYNLNISSDKIVNFKFLGDRTVVDLYADANGDGEKDNPASPSPTNQPFEDVSSLWEAGSLLWTRAASDRKIYTFDGTTFQLFPSSIGSGSPFITLLQAANEDEATAIARYVRGEDLRVCNNSKKICTTLADCDLADTSCNAYRSRTVNSKVWKLGDIINSTPRLASLVPQNLYHKSYLDTTYRKFVESDDYGKRGMVFTGANDGMLHAFYLGQLELFQEKFKKAALTDPFSIGFGKELWTFIPRNVLPYLRYMTQNDYCHVYNVDATPFIVDVSINPPTPPAVCAGDYWDCPKQTKCGANLECTDANNSIDMNNTSWRTILIGSMRLGGACKPPASGSAYGVDTPIANEGYSSYFALDITDTLAHPDDPTAHPPILLWEFSNANIPGELATGGLGFSTTGPAILRVAPKKGDTNTDGSVDGKDEPDNNKNGRFFVVIGSGPTGPIDTLQFRSYSDQPLKIFVLDLKTGDLLKTFKDPELVVKNGFSGSMINSMIDFDQNNPASVGFYQDDAIYVGYTKAEDDPIKPTTKWNRGGVLRIFTKQEIDPGKWAVSTVMDDATGNTAYTNIMGPVTAAVSKLQNYTKKTFRLFFGSGRYSYKISQDIDDDDPKDFAGNEIPRRLFGVVDPCFDTLTGTIDFNCTGTVLFTSLDEAATGAGSSDAEGWYINLDSCTKADSLTTVPCYTTDLFGNTVPNSDATYKAERMVTDIAATPMGAVFFTTTKPSANICAFGGGTHLWATQYDTGGTVKKGVLRGKAIVQVSTGEIKEVELKTAFTEKDGRRTEVIPGVPPAGAPPGLIVPAQPINKIIHIRER